MDIVEYAKMIDKVDSIKMDIGEDNAEKILETMSNTYTQIEDYCIAMIPDFATRGKIIQKMDVNDDSISQELDILINNTPIEKTEYASYIEDINKILTDNFNYIGWEEI